MAERFSYVTYDPETRELTGSYLQELRPEHKYYVRCSDEERMYWNAYRLNADSTALELIPEDPPVDPDPEEPVQSGN